MANVEVTSEPRVEYVRARIIRADGTIEDVGDIQIASRPSLVRRLLGKIGRK